MRRRYRSLAGLFALTAMTLSLAEGVLAATCAPGAGDMFDMGTQREESEYAAEMAAMGMPLTAAAELPAGTPALEAQDGGDRAECPLAPPGQSQGCAVAALPTRGAAAPSDPSSPEFFRAPPTAEFGSVTHRPLFHPPRL